MRHIKALLFKFIMITVVVYLIAGVILDDQPFGPILAVSAIVTALSYLADILFVPRVSNAAVMVLDVALLFVFLFIFTSWWFDAYSPAKTITLVATVVVAVGEYFFHRYLKDHVFDEKEVRTEF